MGYVRRLVLLVILSLIALGAAGSPPASAQIPCGVITPCPRPPDPPPAGGGSTTVDGRTHAVYLNVDPLSFVDESPEEERIRFSGIYAVNGSPAEGHLEIVASSWPYAFDHVIHRTFTHGAFNLDLRAEPVNTRYYARIQVSAYDYVTSPSQKVTLYPDFLSFDTDVVGKYVASMSFRIDLPDGVTFPLSGRKIHWYIARGKGKREKLNQVAQSKTAIKSGYGAENVLRGRVRTRLPRGRYKFRGAFCVDLPVGVEIGVGDPVEGPCP